MHNKPINIGFLLFPGFSMMALSSAFEPLRAANRLSGQLLYRWYLLSSDGQRVESSSGLAIDTESIDEQLDIDRLFLIASMDVEPINDRRIFAFLQRFASRAKVLGAISNGSFILARAGLLEGYQCTVHWESIGAFAEEFPKIQVRREIFVTDRKRWTCAGGIAAIDLMLNQITTDCSAQLAAEVVDQFLVGRIRGPEEHQRLEIQQRFGIHDKRLAMAIACMEQNFEDPLDVHEIARRCNFSLRQMERLWRQHFDLSPQKFYITLRLKEAQRLLRESTDSISAIALKCGFVSTSHMGSAYRTLFGYSPSVERKQRAQASSSV